MTSVINGFGYNGGNQLRVELRTLTNRVDALTTSLNALKELILTLHPDQADAVKAALTDAAPTQQVVSQTPAPPVRTAAQQQAVNRVRP